MFSTLGNIKFTPLKGFNQFQGKRSASLAEHALIDGKPRLQKTGDKLEELTIGMNFNVNFCEPEREVGALHSAMAAGEILPLVWGNGSVAGHYVISDVDRNIEKTTADGSVVQMAVSVTLKEHGVPYNLDALAKSAIARAFAFDEVKPLPLRSLPYPGGPDALVMNQVEIASLANEEIRSNVTRLQQGTAAAIEVGNRIAKAALKIQQSMALVQDVVQQTEQLATAAADLPLRAQQLQTNANALQVLMPPTDLDAVSTAATSVSTSMGAVRSSATPVAAINAYRRTI